MPPGHVLIIRPGALGDAVLTLPALAALHAAGAESLTVLGTPPSWAFLRRDDTAPRIENFGSHEWLGLFADGAALSDRVVQILKRTRTVVIYLRGETIDIERRLTSFGIETIFAFAPPVATPREFAPHAVPKFDVNWNDLTPQHAARRLLDPLAHCLPREAVMRALNPDGIANLGWLAPTRVDIGAQANLCSELGGSRRFFAFHPGSGGRQKCWPAARFAELAAEVWREFKLPSLAIFGPADDFVYREFSDATPPETPVFKLNGRPLREVLTVLQMCRFFIGNDSGISHLAARAAQTYSIFGPTDPEIWAPAGRFVEVIEAPDGDLGALSVEDVFVAVAPDC